MKYIKYTICICIIQLSCDRSINNDNIIISNNNNIITLDIDKSINNDTINYSKYFKNFKITPLQSNNNSQIGYVKQIEIYNDRKYILDGSSNHSLFIFDKNGPVLKKTKYGNGPGELIFPFSFKYIPNENRIYIYDSPNKLIKIYNSNLEYIKEIKITDNFIKDFTIINSRIFYSLSPKRIIGTDSPLILEYNIKNKLNSPLGIHPWINWNIGLPLRYIFSSGKSSFLFSPNLSFIYKINEENIFVKYKFQFTSKMQKEIITNIEKGDIHFNSLFGTNAFVGPIDFFYTEDLEIAIFIYNKKYYLTFIENGKSIITVESNNFIDDLAFTDKTNITYPIFYNSTSNRFIKVIPLRSIKNYSKPIKGKYNYFDSLSKAIVKHQNPLIVEYWH